MKHFKFASLCEMFPKSFGERRGGSGVGGEEGWEWSGEEYEFQKEKPIYVWVVFFLFLEYNHNCLNFLYIFKLYNQFMANEN